MPLVDVAIIGAGVVGLFAAYELARRGYRVALVEAEREPGLGVTGRQANVIHVVQPPPWSLRSRLCIRGNVLYRSRVRDELNIKLLETKLIIASTTRRGVLRLATLYPLLRLVLPSHYRVELLSSRSLLELEPGLSDNVVAGIVIDGYAVISARELVAKLRTALDRLSAEQLYRSRLVAARVEHGKVRLELSSGYAVEARLVVNAAGLYADEVARLLGRYGYRIIARKGVIAVYNRTLVKNIVTAIEAPRSKATKGGAVIPQVNGTTFVGPTLSGATAKNDYTYSYADVSELRWRFQPLLNHQLAEPSRIIVGLRPSTRRADFTIELDARHRAIHLVGIESPGLTAAPAIAEKVLQLARVLLKGG
jgi:glycerol-3-phosphate dehydrogenase